MKKEFAGVLILFCLIVMSGVVNASMQNSIPLNKGNYDIEVALFKGWNLVLISPLLGQDENLISSESDIQKEDLTAIFYYFRAENKYLQLYPSSGEIDTYLVNAREKEEEIRYFVQSAVWVYSERSGILKYSVVDMPDLNDLPLSLSKGWNFITITPDMDGKTLEDIKGNCNFEKVSFFSDRENSAGSWIDIPTNLKFYQRDNAGGGIIIKVSSDCALGSSSSNVNPPSLPN